MKCNVKGQILNKCSLEHAKKTFYRAKNAVFANIGRVASEKVTLLLKASAYQYYYMALKRTL